MNGIVSSQPEWIVDDSSIDRLHGVQIDWDWIKANDPTNAFKDANGDYYVPSGTIMSYFGGYNGQASNVSRKVIPLYLVDPTFSISHSAKFAGLLLGIARENTKTDASTGHGLAVGGVVYANRLPDFWAKPYSSPPVMANINTTIETFISLGQSAEHTTGFATRYYANNAV